ncbi:MAG: ArdC family protein [Planctomycetota bacterium]|nr:ArdC family protein [Planctomycetota bacterium]
MGTKSKVDRVKETLDAVVRMFESGDVPAVVQKAVFPAPNIPIAKWSLRNRVLAALAGTSDARGFRQWKGAGRHVRKGARAFSILGPRMVKVEDKATGDESTRLVGFVAIPVFRLEDTEGESLDYELPTVPAHPLMDVADRWGIKVRAEVFNGARYGWTNGREIVLCDEAEETFFHELGHCADGREHSLKGGQHSDQEIVAELTAAVLARMVGRQPRNDGFHYRYILGYSQKWFPKLSADDALRRGCERVLGRACKAIERILEEADKPAAVAAGAA